MNIARGLRTHFDDGAMEKMPVDLKEHYLYIAEDDEESVPGVGRLGGPSHTQG